MSEAQTNELNPTTEEFAALLDESLQGSSLQEGSVVKGTVVAIEKDLAVVDVGLKTEGRVPLKEFAPTGREPKIEVGNEVEVFLERVENALGEAVLSREKARREESWVRLEQKFNASERVEGVIFNKNDFIRQKWCSSSYCFEQLRRQEDLFPTVAVAHEY